MASSATGFGLSFKNRITRKYVFGRSKVLDDVLSSQKRDEGGNRVSAVRHIVMLKMTSNGSDISVIAQDLLASFGVVAEVGEVFKFLNGFIVDLTPEQVFLLRSDSRVASIEEDGVTPELPLPSEPQLESFERKRASIFFKKDVDLICLRNKFYRC